MKGKGMRHERETVILFNDEDEMLSLWTASETVYRRLLKRGIDLVKDDERSAEFRCPRKWLILPRLHKPKASVGGKGPTAGLMAINRLRSNVKRAKKGLPARV